MALLPRPDPPAPDNTLPGALPPPPSLPPFPDNSLPWPQPPYDNIDPVDIFALAFLRILYPGFFDPRGPNYVDPIQVIISLALANEMRPKCLSQKMQALAQAHYAAYLLQEFIEGEASGGIGGGISGVNSGIVTSEKEGDLSVTYSDPTASMTNSNNAPPSTAWGKWKKMADLCKYGSITTRSGPIWL